MNYRLVSLVAITLVSSLFFFLQPARAEEMGGCFCSDDLSALSAQNASKQAEFTSTCYAIEMAADCNANSAKTFKTNGKKYGGCKVTSDQSLCATAKEAWEKTKQERIFFSTTAPDSKTVAGEGGCPPGRQCLQNPLAPIGKEQTGPTEVTVIIGNIIKAALGVLGSVALYAFIKGGATWLLSFGSPEKVKAGAMTMLWAALGLLVVLASYFLLNQFFILLTSSPK